MNAVVLVVAVVALAAVVGRTHRRIATLPRAPFNADADPRAARQGRVARA